MVVGMVPESPLELRVLWVVEINSPQHKGESRHQCAQVDWVVKMTSELEIL